MLVVVEVPLMSLQVYSPSIPRTRLLYCQLKPPWTPPRNPSELVRFKGVPVGNATVPGAAEVLSISPQPQPI
ncbi:hypothetical protein ACVWZ6_006020 [Bradyrhizobium sp. GM6.1]